MKVILRSNYIYLNHELFHKVFKKWSSMTTEVKLHIVTRTKTSIRYAKENDREEERERKKGWRKR